MTYSYSPLQKQIFKETMDRLRIPNPTTDTATQVSARQQQYYSQMALLNNNGGSAGDTSTTDGQNQGTTSSNSITQNGANTPYQGQQPTDYTKSNGNSGLPPIWRQLVNDMATAIPVSNIKERSLIELGQVPASMRNTKDLGVNQCTTRIHDILNNLGGSKYWPPVRNAAQIGPALLANQYAQWWRCVAQNIPANQAAQQFSGSLLIWDVSRIGPLGHGAVAYQQGNESYLLGNTTTMGSPQYALKITRGWGPPVTWVFLPA